MKNIINLLIFLLAVLAALGMLAVSFSREHYAELSAVILGDDARLMGSLFVDLVVRRETGGILVVLTAFFVAKEFYLRRINTRITLNVIGLLMIMGLASAALHGLYLAPMNG